MREEKKCGIHTEHSLLSLSHKWNNTQLNGAEVLSQCDICMRIVENVKWKIYILYVVYMAFINVVVHVARHNCTSETNGKWVWWKRQNAIFCYGVSCACDRDERCACVGAVVIFLFVLQKMADQKRYKFNRMWTNMNVNMFSTKLEFIFVISVLVLTQLLKRFFWSTNILNALWWCS